MSISYHVVPRKMTMGPDAGKVKYFGQVKAGKKIDYKSLCKRVSNQSSATRGDVSLILDNFLDIMMEYLSAGNVVQVGGVGSFRMSAGSRGADTEEEFNVSYMKKGKVLFYPGVELKEIEKRIKFDRIVPQVVEVPAECDQAHV